MTRIIGITVLLSLAAGLVGCSATGAAMGGGRLVLNLSKKDSNLGVYLDGQKAKQSTLKKGLTGYAPFKVDGRVSTSPKFRYEIDDPKKLGYIQSTHMQIHQEFEADFSDLPDFVVYSTTGGSDAQLKPGVQYDLGNLGSSFTVRDKKNNVVNKIEFQPGREYLLVFTLRADRSESLQVYFQTK